MGSVEAQVVYRNTTATRDSVRPLSTPFNDVPEASSVHHIQRNSKGFTLPYENRPR